MKRICEGGPGLASELENRAFDLPQGEAPFKDIIHFTIRLIPPGGEINVFARNFSLELLPIPRPAE